MEKPQVAFEKLAIQCKRLEKTDYRNIYHDSRMKLLPEIIEHIERAKDNLEFIPTGFRLVDKHLDGGLMRKELVVLGAPSGIGKASWINADIYTPYGAKKMRDIQVGDQVSNPTGGHTEVIAVYPQGKKKIYKITFNDGTFTHVTEDHLWLTWDSRNRRKNGRMENPSGFPEIHPDSRIYTTQEISCASKRRVFRIPLTNPVQFESIKNRKWQRVPPYVLGVLLGDGSISTNSVGVTTVDEEIVQRLSKFYSISSRKLKHGGKAKIYGILGVYKDLEKIYGGKHHLRSWEKFIPDAYKFSLIEERKKLIQGLMDTDGYVTQGGQMQFTTTSPRLADDVTWILRSLGAWVAVSDKIPTFRYKGVLKQGRRAYTIYFRSLIDKDLVTLPRKKERIRGYNGTIGCIGKTIKTIEFAFEDDAKCIRVRHPNGLYITDNFIVTHNSNVATQIFLNVAQKGFKCAYFSLEISNEMTVSRLIGALSNIKPTRIMAGMLEKEEFERKAEAKAKLLAFQDYMAFYDTLYTLDEIEKEIRERGFEFVVIDFIQNIIAKEQDEYSRLSRSALELQKLAKEVNACILVLSQLSNQVAREGEKAPNVEYRGSGSIAMVCDLGFFIEREKKLSFDVSQNAVNLMLRKNRRGIAGVGFELVFLHPGGYIYDPTDETEPATITNTH